MRHLHARWLGFGVALLIVLGVQRPALADHIYSTYGSRGYWWMADINTTAIIWTTSTSCNPRELDAYTAVQSSTVGHFPNKWPAGIELVRQSSNACDGTVDSYTDVKLSYEPASNFVRDDGSTYGGYNESRLAPKSWCNLWAANYPCGSHISTVHLNSARFGSSSYSSAYRQRLIMHETGHSLGLREHCTSDAIMNDGTSLCNGGAWTSVMGYQATDRQGIRNIYPNWPYG